MITVKERIGQVITMLEKVQEEGRQLTETEKMEFTAELLSIAEQRLIEIGDVE